MKSILGTLFIATGTAGVAVGILSGIESLLRSSPGRRQPRPLNSPSGPPVGTASLSSAPPTEAATLAPKADAERNFSIKRTKSEVGYVYWILEGYGKYKCFVLCDSWDEAVAQAKARIAEIDAAEAVPQSPGQPIPASA